jgi:uncharacterized protein YjeT (DUF2065 family)
MTHIILLSAGVYWLLAGIRIFTEPKFAERVLDQFEEHEAMAFFMGVIILLAGVIALQFHNSWNGWREVLASLILWGMAIEGALIVVYPKLLFSFSRKLMPNTSVIRVFGIAIAILGTFLIWG